MLDLIGDGRYEQPADRGAAPDDTATAADQDPCADLRADFGTFQIEAAVWEHSRSYHCSALSGAADQDTKPVSMRDRSWQLDPSIFEQEISAWASSERHFTNQHQRIPGNRMRN